MAAPSKAGSEYVWTDQQRDNRSHDDKYGVNVVELVGENADGTAVLRIKANSDGSISTGTLALPNDIIMREKASDSNIIYIGEAANGSSQAAALWKITRLDTTTLLDVTYADGNLNADNVWNNRESLSYT